MNTKKVAGCAKCIYIKDSTIVKQGTFSERIQDRLLDNNKRLKNEILRLGGDIVRSDRFQKAWTIDHHIRYNVAVHSLEAACYALRIARWLKRRGIKVNEEDVVRAALLHDIGMTEDRVSKSPSYMKAYTHPRAGYRIAKDEFSANKVQLEAIRRHMWPICVLPPLHLTGWIVLTADKASASREAKETAKLKAKSKLKRRGRKTAGDQK